MQRHYINPFHATDLFLYPLKTSENQMFWPFLPEKIVINKEKKITCNFYNIRNYRCHVRLLQQALKHRLIWKKVHRVLKFKQSIHGWSHTLVWTLNLELKQKMILKKNQYKFLNCSVFGKAIQKTKRYTTCYQWKNKKQTRFFSNL